MAKFCAPTASRLLATAFALAALVTGAALRAQDLEELEGQLKRAHLGKPLTLRNFYQGDEIRFSAGGQAINRPASGPWTLYAMLEVASIRLQPGELEIESKRLLQVYEPGLKAFRAVRAAETVRITLELPLGGTDEKRLRTTMKKVFLGEGEKLADIAPLYWKRFLTNDESQYAREVYQVKDVDSPPRLLEHAEPEYNQFARRQQLKGSVVILAVVNGQGRVENPQISEPLGMGLDDAAVQALSRWKFEPARHNGKPVAVRATIEVAFRPL